MSSWQNSRPSQRAVLLCTSAYAEAARLMMACVAAHTLGQSRSGERAVIEPAAEKRCLRWLDCRGKPAGRQAGSERAAGANRHTSEQASIQAKACSRGLEQRQVLGVLDAPLAVDDAQRGPGQGVEGEEGEEGERGHLRAQGRGGGASGGGGGGNSRAALSAAQRCGTGF